MDTQRNKRYLISAYFLVAIIVSMTIAGIFAYSYSGVSERGLFEYFTPEVSASSEDDGDNGDTQAGENGDRDYIDNQGDKNGDQEGDSGSGIQSEIDIVDSCNVAEIEDPSYINKNGCSTSCSPPINAQGDTIQQVCPQTTEGITKDGISSTVPHQTEDAGGASEEIQGFGGPPGNTDPPRPDILPKWRILSQLEVQQDSSISSKEFLCDDQIDNDKDGATDMQDSDCNNGPFIYLEKAETKCSDGLDNDGDGAIDMRDRDCSQLGMLKDPTNLLPPKR